jgi:enoyl-CoA hydratase
MTLPWFGIELARARLAPTALSPAVGLARVYDPDSAVGAGFLDEAVEEADLLPRAVALAEGWSALDMGAHRDTKARFREALFARLEQALERDFHEGAPVGRAAGS